MPADRVVIEEALTESSVPCTCCAMGPGWSPLVSARDYKRLGDSDAGPNTGGMGSNSPVPAHRRSHGRQGGRPVRRAVLVVLKRKRGSTIAESSTED